MRALPWVLLGAVLVILVYALCRRPDPAYWVARQQYVTDTEARDACIDDLTKDSAEKDKIIAAKDTELAASRTTINALKADLTGQIHIGQELTIENAKLKASAQAAIDANPAVHRLIENYDLRCANYEHRIFTLTQMVGELEQRDKLNGEKIVALTAQVADWKSSYAEEHKTRLQGDALRLGLEKRYKTSRFWATLGKWGPPIGVAVGWALGAICK